MLKCNYIIEDADRTNIKYTAMKVSNVEESFDWLVETVQKEGTNTPKTLVFCQSKTQCTTLFEIFKDKLGLNRFGDLEKPCDDRNSIIGMYHKGTRDEQKATAEKAFTEHDSIMKILFCTSSFGTGVDVKSCSLVIHVGPPKLLDEYLQQSGRVDREGQPSNAILLLFSSCISGSGFEDEMKAYVKNSQICRRVTLLTAIQNPRIQPLHILGILDRCCDICAKICRCLCTCADTCTCDEGCIGPESYLTEAEKMLENEVDMQKPIHENSKIYADITDDDRQLFKDGLHQIQSSLIGQFAAKDAIIETGFATGFTDELINGLVTYMEYISSVDMIMEYFPIFNPEHAEHVYAMLAKMFSNKLAKEKDANEDYVCIADIQSSDYSEDEDDLCDYVSKPTIRLNESSSSSSDEDITDL